MSPFPELKSITEFDVEREPARQDLSADLASHGTIRRLKAGETLYVEGDAAPYCYQIVSGDVKEYNTLEDGRRQVVDFYGVGEIFGICELEEQLHTAEAVTDCTVRCYGRDAFLRTIASSPDLSQRFLNSLMMRLHRTRERMIMLGRMSAAQRVASFLLRLAGDHHSTENVRFVMSRQDIADHLGLTIETVCRMLTEFKRKSIVEMRTARVFSITDGLALEAVARGRSAAH